MEDHANRQCGLDGDVLIGTLAAGFAAGGLAPGIECFIRNPDGKVTTLLETRLVFSLIPYPISGLRVLVLAPFRVHHRWLLQGRGLHITLKLQP
jgi:hypothetical protein